MILLGVEFMLHVYLVYFFKLIKKNSELMSFSICCFVILVLI